MPSLPAGKVVMAVGIAWFSLASLLLPTVAVTPWTAALGLTLPAVLASRFLVGLGEGELGACVVGLAEWERVGATFRRGNERPGASAAA
jgi:hypothetical protein